MPFLMGKNCSVNKIEKKKNVEFSKYNNIPRACFLFTLVLLNNINFMFVYQSQMVHHKTLVDVTPVQPAFQYRGKKCESGYRMVSLLVTI